MQDDASRTWAGGMSEAYDELLVPAVFQPYADDLADRVAGLAPRTLLELAAGTGVVTEAVLARLPGVALTATDLSDAMVAVGARRAPGATWRQADAMSLPFADGAFDVVACQFGVMFFPDRPAAYAEAARVLRPGGAFLLSTWGPLADHEIGSAVLAALAELFPDDAPTFLERVPHGYHDQERLTADLASVGFTGIEVEVVERSGTSPGAVALANGFCRGTPLRAEIEARGDLEATVPAVADALTRAFGPGPVAGRMTALVATAYAP